MTCRCQMTLLRMLSLLPDVVAADVVVAARCVCVDFNLAHRHTLLPDCSTRIVGNEAASRERERKERERASSSGEICPRYAVWSKSLSHRPPSVSAAVAPPPVEGMDPQASHSRAPLAVGVVRSEAVILDRVSLSHHVPVSRFLPPPLVSLSSFGSYITLFRTQQVPLPVAPCRDFAPVHSAPSNDTDSRHGAWIVAYDQRERPVDRINPSAHTQSLTTSKPIPNTLARRAMRLQVV